MPKLTLPQILALARAAGHDLGGPTADGAGIVAQLRAEHDRDTKEIAALKRACRSLESEREQARKRLAEVPAVPVEGATFAKVQGELFEARAEVVALKRTCDKLRERETAIAIDRVYQNVDRQAQGLPPILSTPSGLATVVDRAETVQSPQDAPGSTIDPAKVLLVRFAGAQGYGTADKLKALGARWTWDPKQPGEPRSTSGAWRVPASPEALALLEALRADGRTLTVSA